MSHTVLTSSGARRPLHLAVLLIPTVLTTFAGCSRGADAQPQAAVEAAVPVRIVTLDGSRTAPAGAIEVSGTLAGKEEVPLAFKIGGVISRIAVDVGQSVRAGQVLAELRPTEIAAQVANAREAQQKAERDLARVTKLYADSVATLEQLQDTRTALQVATNTVRSAQFNADFAVIRAPGDGIVLSRDMEPGQVIDAGRPVLSVRRAGLGLVVHVGLSDRDAVRVRLGDRATVRFDAMAGTTYDARVTQRAASASRASGTYDVELTLSGAPSSLPSGLVASVRLTPTGGGTASAGAAPVRVPLDALVDADADSAAVFVMAPDGQTVQRKPVKLSDVAEALRTAQVPVISGLVGNERVVVAGMSRLLDGTRVRVVTGVPQTGADARSAENRTAP